MEETTRILMVEDDPFQAELVKAALESSSGKQFSCVDVDCISEVENAVAEKEFDICLLDLFLPDSKGLETMKKVQELVPDLPLVILSGMDDESAAIEAVQKGAQDFLVKGQSDLKFLPRIINHAIERARITKDLELAKKEAEEATKLKDKFVSLVAHDLKSPFNAILGYLGLMNDDQVNPVHENHRKMITRMMDSGKRTVKMIQELLDINRLQTGKVILEKKFFDGYFTCASVVGNLKQLADKKEISVIHEIPRGFRLYGDSSLFGEVILNLVSNAIKFCKKGDTITILAPPDEKMGIAVKDTGVGISETRQANIFKPEEITTTMGTAGERGTGLGLPFSHDIMKYHGGELTVESVEGEGATFQATLPFTQPRILIVEDSERTRKLFKESLKDMGLEILESESAEAAIEILEEDLPHLIILDVYLPGMDGFELLEIIKKDPKTKSIPVIIITSDEKIEVRNKAFQMGANDFVTKPFQLDELIPRVRRFVV